MWSGAAAYGASLSYIVRLLHSTMSRATKIAAGIMVPSLLLPVGIFVYFLGVQHYTPQDSFHCTLLWWGTDTRWADDASPGKFNKIEVGMTRDEVRERLGEPIYGAQGDHWAYTWSPSSTHYHTRDVAFSSAGRVTELVRGFYLD